MPSGRPDIIGPAINRIMVMNPSSILDVGSGFGKWGLLLREYLEVWQGRLYPFEWRKRIDALEIYGPYTNLSWYSAVYDDVFVGSVLDHLDLVSDYDLVLLMDVVEHLEKQHGRALLGSCQSWILSTPTYRSRQGLAFGNPHEKHLSFWNREDFNNAVVIDGKWILAWG